MTGLDWAIGWVRDTWPVWAALALVVVWIIQVERVDARRRGQQDAEELAALKRRLSPPSFRRFVPTVIPGGRRMP